ncbi:AfsR/SARP family transcriptional regulator [Streptomyces litchfieldiae]|uniref:BTAD domain-containing putative transcriptional regulator n=1 Tax=Streptomyces litchfieldiae TaxID=3075543 RepID=A0ABU2MP91_9ACTN|nr:BTAD domain-containing putative transcriptional regulator [Streptomyces sp. DSM 44938]MDT0343168.1 BTAD domain-containing putative transcriptional regulator [Streptomyces sp. DSM 44938]
MEFRLLGAVGVWRGEHRLGPVTAQQRTVLALLLLDPGRAVPVDRLITALWGDRPPVSARNSVQGCVSRLRRTLTESGTDAELTTSAQGYRLRVDRDRVDLHRFRDLVRLAQREEPTRGHELLGQALELWRGAALAEVAGRWLPETVAPGLEEERLAAHEERAVQDLHLGRPQNAAADLSALVAAHPLRERAVGILLMSLHQTGRRAEALALFRRVRQQFVEELGIEPGEELQRAHQAILNGGDPARTVPRQSPPAPVAAPPAAPATPAVPRQLPPDIEHFTSRAYELEILDALARKDRVGGSGAPVVCVIAGTGGVGKTALAVHWAHRARDRYPDGQLYLNLRGFGPTDSAVPPADAVRVFLDTLQVPASRIPAAFEAQVGLFRGLLADRRMLILLDNARDSDQVRPLLPTSPGSLVLVTSRNELTGLAVTDGAHQLTLDLLSAAESRELLDRRLGPGAFPGEQGSMDDIIALCAGLPLALAIVAARATTQPALPLSTLPGDAYGSGDSLDVFDSGDPSTDVRTVFSWSYRALSPEAARLFRLLGLAESPDLTMAAIASLAGEPLAVARRLLTELVRAHLVGQRSPGHYASHDLLWAYALELTLDQDPKEERRAALHRLLDHYLHSAVPGDDLLNPNVTAPIMPAPAQPHVTVTPLHDAAQARAWYADQLPALLAAVRQAAHLGFDAHAAQLAHASRAFLFQEGHAQHQVTTHRIALDAARRLFDLPAQALSHLGLGQAYHRLGQFDETEAHLLAALRLYEQLDDKTGQGRTHSHLGHLRDQQGRRREGLVHVTQALILHRASGHRAGQAQALNNIGWFHAALGAHEEALRYCEKALAMQQELGNANGHAAALDSLGYVHHHLGHHERAIGYYERALDWRRGRERVSEAETLARLAEAQLAAGRREECLTTLRQSLRLFTEVAHPGAETVTARLAELTADD